MKNPASQILIVLLAAFAVCVRAQDSSPKAILVDSLPTVRSNCEERMMVMDRYISALNGEPAGQGYIMIYKQLGPEWIAKSRETEIRKYLAAQKFDPSRVTIIQGGDQGSAKIEYWIVPPGADKPSVREWDGAVSGPPPQPLTEPRNFSQDHPDGCGTDDLFLEGYAEELDFIGPSPGRVVIHARSTATFQKRKQALTSELAKYGIRASRLTFVYKPEKRHERVELWILPLKKGTKPAIAAPGI